MLLKILRSLARLSSGLRYFFRRKRIELSCQKCVWFTGKNDIAMPDTLECQGTSTEAKAAKFLGAFVGENQSVSSKLVQQLEKHDTIFRRLEAMGANNISLRLLSKSVNVRQNYHIRVHPPQASLDLTRNFDEKVNSVLQSWFGNLTAEQILWMRLPLKKGGLGLSPTEPFRQTAYETSKSISLEHFNLNSARECLLAAPKPVGENSITDSKANTALYHENIRTRLMLNPKDGVCHPVRKRKGEPRVADVHCTFRSFTAIHFRHTAAIQSTTSELTTKRTMSGVSSHI